MVTVRKIVGHRRVSFTFPKTIRVRRTTFTYYRNFTSQREANSFALSLRNKGYPAEVGTVTTTIPNPKDPKNPLFRQIFVVYRGKRKK